MAERGRPRGAWSDKEWQSAIRTAIREPHAKHGTKLRALANAVVKEALAGQAWAVTEIGNRLDGKAAQNLHVTGSVTHDLSGVSDAQLAAIIAETASGERSAETPDDPGQLH